MVDRAMKGDASAPAAAPATSCSCWGGPEVLLSMTAYSLSSALLMIINKACMKEARLPSFLSIVQFAAAAGTVWMMSKTGHCPEADVELKPERVKPYFIYSVIFCAVIYSNLQALYFSSLATVLVFRAGVPLVVAILDYLFLGRELPNLRSSVSLICIAAATYGYVYNDMAFKLQGLKAYTWVSIYALSLSAEMAYAKHIVGPQMNFASIWGSVYHNNLLSIPLMTLLGVATNEEMMLSQTTWSVKLQLLIAVSCVASVLISYTGWNCRKKVSASCYTVLGVGNKILTILVNSFVWEDHTSWAGRAFLFVCLVSACLYQQSPLRDENSKPWFVTCCARVTKEVSERWRGFTEGLAKALEWPAEHGKVLDRYSNGEVRMAAIWGPSVVCQGGLYSD